MKTKMQLLAGIVLFVCGLGVMPAQTVSPVIVDNRDPGFGASASWATGQAWNNYGLDFRYRSTAPVSDPATWKAITPGGARSVYAWWPSAASIYASTRAPYIVYHGTGSTTVYVNQGLNGGKWNLLGTFNLVAGSNRVLLSPWTTTGYIVMADAIKWQ